MTHRYIPVRREPKQEIVSGLDRLTADSTLSMPSRFKGIEILCGRLCIAGMPLQKCVKNG